MGYMTAKEAMSKTKWARAKSEAMKDTELGAVGKNILEDILSCVDEAAENEKSKIEYNEYVSTSIDSGRKTCSILDLVSPYKQVYNNLVKLEYKVTMKYCSETRYGSGSYGEDEYISGFKFNISWE